MNKIFSLGYPQNTQSPSLYYNLLKNSSQQYRNEISDIYFSSPFIYETKDGNIIKYGDVMSITSSKDHDEYLFKIKNELGIDVSLTFNDVPPNPHIVGNKECFDSFINHIRYFYENGLRMCTISNTHMMATGVLQKEFPEMHWKNTVNNIVYEAQQVLDYHMLGYNTILLDRSLNRNIEELRNIKKLQERYKFKTSLLVKEGCMPSCPFKVEHDDMGSTVGQGYYWDNHAEVSCPVWRNDATINNLPRIGTDLVTLDSDTWNEFNDLVDIFKYSGRTGNIEGLLQGESEYKFVWSLSPESSRYTRGQNVFETKDVEDVVFAESFKHIVDNNHKPVSMWFSATAVPVGMKNSSEEEVDAIGKKHTITTKKGESLNKILKTCKNACYDCHACEKVYGIKSFDSLIELNRDSLIDVTTN